MTTCKLMLFVQSCVMSRIKRADIIGISTLIIQTATYDLLYLPLVKINTRPKLSQETLPKKYRKITDSLATKRKKVHAL